MAEKLEFDYVIAGAGSAGCVLAARLSEDRNATVLLLEAGKRASNPLIRVPLLGAALFLGKTANWRWETEPEPHLDRRRVYQPRGKALGGSSVINGMVYIRGHARDYDLWAQSGLTGWSYADVLPYFRRSEASERRADPFHGEGGPLSVTRGRLESPLLDALIAAAASAGYNVTDDFNGLQQEGIGRYDYTIKNGRRHSVAVAFLAAARGRSNLAIRTECHAARIAIEGGRAVALDYLERGNAVRVRARREIIVSSGAFASPALLLRSGIGPAAEIASFGIPVVHDLPGVGRNMQDHLTIRALYAATKPVTLYSLRRPDRAGWAVLQALLFGTGPGTQMPFMAGGFLRTRPELERPDVQFNFVPALPAAGVRTVLRAAPEDRHGFFGAVCVLRPESRGAVKLRSPDPLDPPAIHGNYFAAENDRRTLRDGFRIMRRLFAQPSFDPYRGEELAPGAAATSDAAIDAHIRAQAYTMFHPVGTCRMGNDADSVVDAALRVHGIEGLRVVDASIMPEIIGGNTNAPVIMIAEKAADMILGRTPPPRAAIPGA